MVSLSGYLCILKILTGLFDGPLVHERRAESERERESLTRTMPSIMAQDLSRDFGGMCYIQGLGSWQEILRDSLMGS